MRYPIANLSLADGTIKIKLYNHPEMELMNSAQIISACRKHDAFKVEIESNNYHVVQLVHDLETTGFKITSCI